MKVLMSILREMADLPADASDLRDALDSLGLAVESVDHLGARVEGVVAARILRTERHPDAAKVTRCWVDAGDGEERHVWCGASNMGPGDVVPLAMLGSRMPDGREISRRGILGIDSEGMLCSATELGLGQDDSGLLILPSSATLGQSVFEVLGVEEDVLFDLDLTRNRPDCWGHLGIARDLAAFFRVPVRGPRLHPVAHGSGQRIPVQILDQTGCGRFTVTRLGGIQVTESPAWVRTRLERLGMRPINNVVDASNLAMLETNQPNHAYDAAVVDAFSVRLARPGEALTTLDGVTRILHTEDLVICDGQDVPVGLAGIMGDLVSEIRESTTEVLLECAWFDPDSVRFSAQRHGLRTEASLRFERGVDPDGWTLAVTRFATILSETCPDLVVFEDPAVVEGASHSSRVIFLADSRVESVLGRSVPGDEIQRILNALGFLVSECDGGLRVTVPSWRPDCSLDVDIVEEVARHVGYENIGRRVPLSATHGRLSPLQKRRRELRRILTGMGLDEAMPNPFLAPGALTAAGLDESLALRIANPLTVEESVLRTSLRPGLLTAVRHNLSHRAENVRLFEMGHVYPAGSGALPDEAEVLAIMVVGADASVAVDQWNSISDALGVGALLDQSRVPQGLHSGRSASLTRGKQVIGMVGEIDPWVLDNWGVSERISLLELDLGVVLAESPKPVQANAVNRAPTSDVDISFLLPENIPAGDLHRALRQAAGALLVNLWLFDVYRGAGIPEAHRSLTFRLRLQGSSGSLPEGAAAEILTRCSAAAQKLGAIPRS